MRNVRQMVHTSVDDEVAGSRLVGVLKVIVAAISRSTLSDKVSIVRQVNTIYDGGSETDGEDE